MSKKVFLGFVLVLVTLLLGACSGGNSECIDQYCVSIEVQGPYAVNQPFIATITVDPAEDIADLEINAYSNSPSVSFEQGHWTVDVFEGQSVVVTTTVTIDREGFFRIYGNATKYSSGVEDVVSLQLDSSGGVLNPTSDGPNHQGASQTDGSTYTSSPSEDRPTPFDAYLPDPDPQAALSACGFSHSSPTDWEGAGLSLTFYGDDGYLLKPDEIVAGEMITIQVDFQAPYESSQNTRVKLGFCLPSGQTFFQSNDLANGKKVWNIQTQPGQIYSNTISGVFTSPAEYTLPLTSFVQSSGDVSGRLPKVSVRASGAPPQTTGWTQYNEDFEALIWPPLNQPDPKWVVTHNTAPVIIWDNSSYKSYGDDRAVWPGFGWDGIPPGDPPLEYFDDSDTRMSYGPIDLSNATVADVWFWLSLDVEFGYDFLSLEVSTDGVNYNIEQSWTGSDPIWDQAVVDLSDYLGNSQVWVSWRFISDSSNHFAGPWIDDIIIWKFEPGTITVSGKIEHYDEADVLVPSPYTRIHLYDADSIGSNDYLASTTTDALGNYSFPSRTDWDTDDSDPDPYNRRLDLYVRWETAFNDDNPSNTSINTRVVEDVNYSFSVKFNWTSMEYTNADYGNLTINDKISLTDPNLGAMWIFQDARNAWAFVNAQSRDPGDSLFRWRQGVYCRTLPSPLPPIPICSSHFFPGEGVFIRYGNEIHRNTVNHEQGHQYLSNLTGSFWFFTDIPGFFTCLSHTFESQESLQCAFTEGWADYFSVIVNGGSTYSAGQGLNYDLETPSVAPGVESDDREVWVAAALYDLDDTASDGFDNIGFPFANIWDIAEINLNYEFDDYWQLWLNANSSSSSNHWAIQSIFQNTIDYNDPPNIVINDFNILQGLFPLNNFVSLFTVTTDDVSLDSQLSWWLDLSGFNTNDCSITIDAAHYLDLDVFSSGFLGSCGQVTVNTSDGLEENGVTFTVNIVQVTTKVFQPAIYDGGALEFPYPPPEEDPPPGAPPPGAPGAPPPPDPSPTPEDPTPVPPYP